MIKISKYTELDLDTKRQLESMAESSFGHFQIVRDTEWAMADWSVIRYQENQIQISSFYNIVERNILIDNKEVKTAGINNVITPQQFRGLGYASQMLKSTEYFIFEKLKCKAGLLLCADELIPFYENLGWYTINCPLHFDQPGGERLWTGNAMLLTPGEKLLPKSIHLNGLPW